MRPPDKAMSLLEIKDLTIRYHTSDGIVTAVTNLDIDIGEGETLGLVGETGAGNMRIIFSEIIPNAMAPIIVDTTLKFGANILMISSLSFIGLGVQPPIAEWGSIMTSGRNYIRDFYPIVTFPGIAIMLTLFGFNLLGDGLRDALDPKLKD